MEKQISITLDISEIRAILDNLALIDMELLKLNSAKRANIRAIELNFQFTAEEWEIILNR